MHSFSCTFELLKARLVLTTVLAPVFSFYVTACSDGSKVLENYSVQQTGTNTESIEASTPHTQTPSSATYDSGLAQIEGNCILAPELEPPHLSDPGSTVVAITSEPGLQQALSNLENNTVLLLEPGDYLLENTLWINNDNITIRGNSNRCDDVQLIGKGMENLEGSYSVPNGVWTASSGLKIQNLTIRDVYFHGVTINGGGYAPEIYNVALLDTGQQFIKTNPLGFANGVDDGRVEYTVMKYTATPPQTEHGGGTGYTNGVDVHGGINWVISNNLFENFHTEDSAQNQWNPAVLMWNGASGTLVENNRFINVDRAIAFGLADRSNDHFGGVIRNNMIVMHEGLYSDYRRSESDAPIIVWSSPQTKVLHNTVITQGNTNKSIELRFDSNDSQVVNNLVDAPIGDRSGNSFEQRGNFSILDTGLFSSVRTADLHLIRADSTVTKGAGPVEGAPRDIDGDLRHCEQGCSVGADEYID